VQLVSAFIVAVDEGRDTFEGFIGALRDLLSTFVVHLLTMF
jgi:hypothetical protein